MQLERYMAALSDQWYSSVGNR